MHGSRDVRLQSRRAFWTVFLVSMLRWTPVYVGHCGGNFALAAVYKTFLGTVTRILADPDPDIMIRVDAAAAEAAAAA
jgi:hypothetical protein